MADVTGWTQVGEMRVAELEARLKALEEHVGLVQAPVEPPPQPLTAEEEAQLAALEARRKATTGA